MSNNIPYRGPPGPRGLSVIIEPNYTVSGYINSNSAHQQNVCPPICQQNICPPQPCPKPPCPQPCNQTVINNITNNITQTTPTVLTVHCPQFITLPGLPYDLSGNTASGYVGYWGTGSGNLNYFIGNPTSYSSFNDPSGNAYTSYTAPLNYINYLPFDVVDPVQNDITAFDISGQIVPTRGYMVTDFWNPPVQPVYYFYGQWAMYRTPDTNAINASGGGPWRYYLELQPTTSLDLQEVEQPQLFTYLPLPDITASGEVDSYVEGTMPLPSAFNYVPNRGFRLALWGQQGPNPWSRRSHSTTFISTPPELLNLTAAEINYTDAINQYNLDYESDPGNIPQQDIINVSGTWLALQNAENALPNVLPSIRVWPNFGTASGVIGIPISLDAWVGIQPPTIKKVYYICKFSVNAVVAGNDQLMITSTSSTTPIGAPVAYPHYQNPISTYTWKGTYGTSAVVLSSPQPNPYPVEGSGYTQTNGATAGYLTFIPIYSNSVYQNNVMTNELIDSNVPIPDSGFSMSFELEKEIGLKINSNSAHKIFVRRLNPTPSQFTADLIDSGSFMLEPILLTDEIYPQLDGIALDDIDGTKGPVWDTQNTTVIYTTNGKTVEPYGFYGNGLVSNPGIPSGMFTYSLTPRDFTQPDTDTAIISINYITYQ